MKALKEKRISLRSLARRSLVILSLLALVFASCGDSEGNNSGGGTGGGSGVEGRQILSMSWLPQNPTAVGPFLEGTPVDLTGLALRVRYNTGNGEDFATITDTSQFMVSPAYYLHNNNHRDPTTYTVFFRGADANMRHITKTFTIAAPDVRELMNFSYHHGIDKREYYSDELPDLAGVELEAQYRYADTASQVYETGHRTITVPRNYEFWSFSLPNEDAFLRLTIPTNVATPVGSSGVVTFAPADLLVCGSVEVGGVPSPGDMIPLDKIWYAKELAWENDTVPEYGPVFVFDRSNPNAAVATTFSSVYRITNLWDSGVTPAVNTADWYADTAWENRFKSGSLVVTYREGDKYTTGETRTKTISIQDMLTMRDLTITGATPPAGGLVEPEHLFSIKAVETEAIAKGKNPLVEINYRGVVLEVPVNIYTKLTGVTAVRTDGGTDAMLIDCLGGAGGLDQGSALTPAAVEAAIAKNIEVTATYQSGRSTTDTVTKVIPFGYPNWVDYTYDFGRGIRDVYSGTTTQPVLGTGRDVTKSLKATVRILTSTVGNATETSTSRSSGTIRVQFTNYPVAP